MSAPPSPLSYRFNFCTSTVCMVLTTAFFMELYLLSFGFMRAEWDWWDLNPRSPRVTKMACRPASSSA